MSRTVAAFFLFGLMGFTSYAQVVSPDKSTDDQKNTTQETSEKIEGESLEDSYQSLATHVEQDTDKVKELYYIKTQVASDYGGATQTISRVVKPHIYKAGERLRKYYMTQLDEAGEDNFDQKISILNKVESLNSNLKRLSRKANTKSFEKTIKKIKDPAEIETLLQNN